jgi:hypothetical protein
MKDISHDIDFKIFGFTTFIIEIENPKNNT